MLKDDQGRRICFQCRKPNITCRCWLYEGYWITLSWGAMQDLLEDVDAKARAESGPTVVPDPPTESMEAPDAD